MDGVGSVAGDDGSARQVGDERLAGRVEGEERVGPPSDGRWRRRPTSDGRVELDGAAVA